MFSDMATHPAPEALLRAPPAGYPQDTWAVGCILAEMSRGLPLFSRRAGITDSDVFDAIFAHLGAPTPAPAPLFFVRQFATSVWQDRLVGGHMLSEPKGGRRQ